MSSCVQNRGHASPFFHLHRGVRQRCPLSGLLFMIGIKLLTRTLQNCYSIKGINICKKDIKLSQSTDGITVFVRHQVSVCNLLKLLCNFEYASDLEINTTNQKQCGWVPSGVGGWGKLPIMAYSLLAQSLNTPLLPPKKICKGIVLDFF